jgi:hypothetical protein
MLVPIRDFAIFPAAGISVRPGSCLLLPPFALIGVEKRI